MVPTQPLPVGWEGACAGMGRNADAGVECQWRNVNGGMGRERRGGARMLERDVSAGENATDGT